MVEQAAAGSGASQVSGAGEKGKHRGAAGARPGRGKGNQRKDLGRREYFRQDTDKRDRNAEEQSKRLRLDDKGTWVTADGPYTKEEIEAEERRPKHKVAVMIGYSGTGYKGMQIMPNHPTIEGDLFKAMIAAGAISKANASDPKKNSLVRCARTDKGVHAAGNMISLKLIIEDEDVVSKINEHLPEQIRVWGIERTTGSFSCYQACDSRWYEYLIPTHCFLPPHPSSFLGTKLAALAEEAADIVGHKDRQQEVEDWWSETETKYIRPVLDELEEDIREEVSYALHKFTETLSASEGLLEDETAWDENESEDDLDDEVSESEPTPVSINGPPAQMGNEPQTKEDPEVVKPPDGEVKLGTSDPASITGQREHKKRIDAAVKRLRQAYVKAKATYRLSPQRLSRIKDALEQFVGTHNYHNFTVRKSPQDPSARRHIKSFGPVAAPSSTTETGTYIIGNTEWLSIKVHGQSFMMHQIRKMIAMATLVVRCGCDPTRIRKALWNDVVIAVPKAPSLGLLLERPVFDSYNEQRAAKFGRESLTFDKYEKELNDFKERQIYQRIHEDEERDHVYHGFFNQIDEHRSKTFLYLTSKGFDAVPGSARNASKYAIGKGNRNKAKNRELAKKRRRSVDETGAPDSKVMKLEETQQAEGKASSPKLHEVGPPSAQ